MVQLVYENRFLMHGNINEVIMMLKALANEYRTVKDFLDSTTAKMK